MFDAHGYKDIIFSHIETIWTSICSLCVAKGFIGALVAFFWYLIGINNETALGALLSLMAIDFVTALSAASYMGVPIESRRALKSATKVIIYALFISAGHLSGVAILGTNWIETAVISFLALTELVSIMENIGKMGYMVPQRLLNSITALRNEK